MVIAFLAACDHRPVQKDLPKSEGNSVDHSRMHTTVIESSPNAASAPYEVQFLDTMIAHHETAIEAAQLAPTRAGRQELKDLAKNIIARDRAEIDRMRELRQRYFSGAAPAVNADLPGMSDAMKAVDLEKLDDLKESPFDLEFIRQMTSDREGAALMAQDEVARWSNGSGNAEIRDSLRQLAQTIVDSQNTDIKELKDREADIKK